MLLLMTLPFVLSFTLSPPVLSSSPLRRTTKLYVKRPFYEIYGDEPTKPLSPPKPPPPSSPPPPKTDKPGHSHTFSSRSKISKANRGKVPWNKGKTISDERRENIRKGVVKAMLQKSGLTMEEYDIKKAVELKKANERAERRAVSLNKPSLDLCASQIRAF